MKEALSLSLVVVLVTLLALLLVGSTLAPPVMAVAVGLLGALSMEER